jgi:hypothetical protein
MGSERGQASVEWIALLLLLALGLAALARFAPRADASHLGAELLKGVTCAARGGCEVERGAPAPRGGPNRLVTVPPLVPVARRPGTRSPMAPLARGGRRRLRLRLRPPDLAPLARRARRGAGTLWRRSWMLCLGYERVRYSVLHPEMRFPHQTIPISEDLRIANDCLSPVDLVRDFGPPPK